MGRHSLVLVLGFLSSLHAEVASIAWPTYFEQTSAATWSGRSSLEGARIAADQFILPGANLRLRFRWDARMGLSDVGGDSLLEGHSYVLRGDGSDEFSHAERVRSSGSAGYGVVYYSGSRGFEFDVEVQPRKSPDNVGFESLDADLSVDGEGRLLAGGQVIALKPVAYQNDDAGARTIVTAEYQLDDVRHVRFVVGEYESNRKLIIDPVTFITKYAPQGTTGADVFAFRELAGGDVLIAGQAYPDEGYWLNAPLTGDNRCYVARLSLATKTVKYVSYFGDSGGDGGGLGCTSVDVDADGRIFVLGQAAAGSTMITADAQFRGNGYNLQFLARISATGRQIEYATYLLLGCQDPKMSAGRGGRVYLGCLTNDSGLAGSIQAPGGAFPTIPGRGTFASIQLYNTELRRYERYTYFAASTISLMTVSPTGAVFITGSTTATDLPLKDAFFTTPPANIITGGAYIAAFSPDLSTLTLSSYVSGQGGFAFVTSLSFEPGGAIRIFGTAKEGAIPGLNAIPPFSIRQGAFTLVVTPGVPGFQSGAWLTNPSFRVNENGDDQSIVLPDGRLCVTGNWLNGLSLSTKLLACTDKNRVAFESTSDLPGILIQRLMPSSTGGVWVMGSMTGGIAPQFAQDAMQPIPTSLAPAFVHVDPSPRKPILFTPNPLWVQPLEDLRGRMTGENFGYGMVLRLPDRDMTLVVPNNFVAQVNTSGYFDGLQRGYYTGKLVTQPLVNPLESEPFPVVVPYRAPLGMPVEYFGVRGRLLVFAPVYDETVVTWRGRRLPLIPYENPTQRYVDLPADLMQPGQGVLEVRNPQPGGGVSQVVLSINTAGDMIVPLVIHNMPWTVATLFTVDKAKGLVYFLPSTEPRGFSLGVAKLDAPDQSRIVTVNDPPTFAVTAMDLSYDGAFVYVLDNRGGVSRYRTDTLQRDVAFSIPADLQLPYSNTRTYSLVPMKDSPETVVMTTPAGRLIVVDGAARRPYTSGDFPSVVPQLRAILATRDFVYAVSGNVFSSSNEACLIRYPVDSLGLGEPEQFCNLPAQWGKYSEMRRVGRRMLLTDGIRTLELSLSVAPSLAVGLTNLDLDTRLLAAPETIPGASVSGAPRSLVRIQDFETEEVLYRYPSDGFYEQVVRSVSLAGSTMLLQVGNRIYFVLDWRTQVADAR